MLKKLALAVALASTITAANASNDYTIVPGHNVIGEEQTYTCL